METTKCKRGDLNRLAGQPIKLWAPLSRRPVNGMIVRATTARLWVKAAGNEFDVICLMPDRDPETRRIVAGHWVEQSSLDRRMRWLAADASAA